MNNTKNIIKSSNEKLIKLKSKIIDDIKYVLKDLEHINYTKSENKNYKISKITSFDDTDNIMYGIGFYIILSNYPSTDKTHKIIYNQCRPIYRGHGTLVKQRIRSHLFKKCYDLDKKGTTYSVCMKIEPKINGININEEPYKNYEWYVITFPLTNSTKFLRECYEESFDINYDTPIFSRDKKIKV